MPTQRPEPAGATERRQQPRLEIELAAEYRILRPWVLWPPSWKRDQHRRARVRNLGPGGLLLLVEEELPASAVLSLTVSLPGEEALVRSLGEVRHLRHAPEEAPTAYAAGVEFLSISSRDTSAIARIFLRHRLN
jgi:c-di-GMP-binding flagellar brake protein YcgR